MANAGKNVDKLEPFPIVCKNVKWCSCCETHVGFPKICTNETNTTGSYNLAAGYLFKSMENKLSKRRSLDSRVQHSIIHSILDVQYKCPMTDKRIKKCGVHKMKYSADLLKEGCWSNVTILFLFIFFFHAGD